jgi:Immunity protein 22
MSVSERMKKIHVWFGTTEQSNAAFKKYFQLDYSTEGDFDDPAYKLCGFCKDTGNKWYDEDMIGIIPVSKKEEAVDKFLKKIPISPKQIEEVKKSCENLGVGIGNAIFYYTDAEFKISPPLKKTYNDLKYIGFFESSLF